MTPTAVPRDRLRVLVVERDAHLSRGHFPVRFAALARAFAELGASVDVLTQQGWLFEGDRGSDGLDRDDAFRVHRYHASTRRLEFGSRRIARSVTSALRAWGNSVRWVPRRYLSRSVGVVDCAVLGLASALGALEVRRWGRRRGAPDLVIVLTSNTAPGIFAAVAGVSPCLVYAFAPPFRLGSLVDRALLALRATRMPLCIATPNPAWRAEWAAMLPSARVFREPIAGADASQVARDPRARTRQRVAARTELGIQPDARVALLFGSGHPLQVPDVIDRAFSGGALDGVALVVGGNVADRCSFDGAAAILRRGFMTDAEREGLFAAADLVLLSFVDGYQRDSGTLVDALTYGLPVVVSARSRAAELVEQYELGVAFRPGDVESFIAAVRRAPMVLSPEVVARAQREMSQVAVARRFLELTGLRPAEAR